MSADGCKEAGDIVEFIDQCQAVLDKHDQDLFELFRNDSSLSDLLKDNQNVQSDSVSCPDHDLICSAIELQLGRAMRLTFIRGDGIRFPLTVPITAQVIDLRQAVQQVLTKFLARTNPSCHVHWRSVWRTKCLAVISSSASNPLPPKIIKRLDVLRDRLKEDCNVQNGSFITMIRRINRK